MLNISKIWRNSKESLWIEWHFNNIRSFMLIWGREKIIPLFYLEIIVKILYMARYFILMLKARSWNLESYLIILNSNATCLQNNCDFSSLLYLISLKNVKEKTNFTNIINGIFTLQENLILKISSTKIFKALWNNFLSCKMQI